MYKRKGIKLVIMYFFQCHLFDLINKTDTHTWLRKDKYKNNLVNLKHGVLYMCSWTSSVKKSFNFIHKYEKNLSEFTFIDVGCGKGKVILVWTKEILKNKIKQLIIGIDYYKSLINIANKNYKIFFSAKGNFYNVDVLNFPFNDYGKVILYLYNPFNKNILNKMVKKISRLKVIVVYNNPVHLEIFLNTGYTEIYKHNSFHPAGNIVILKNF